MRGAAIDLGTNTFHLLIFDYTDCNVSIIQKVSRFVYIGKGGINEGKLSDDAMQRALSTLHEFKTFLVQESVPNEYVMAVATSAIRNAKNGKELIERIYQETQISVRVISGDEEATLIYEGVRKAVPIPHGQIALLMDIGGGSTEFILANTEQLLWKQSFEIGAQRLYDNFHHQEPISPSSVMELENYLNEKLSPLWKICQQYSPNFLIGSAGTFNTLRAIHAKAHGKNPDTEAYEIPRADFLAMHHQFLIKNREERLAIEGMVEKRVDMIVVASCSIRLVLEKLSINLIRTSTASLREGVMQKLLKNMQSNLLP